VTSKKLFRSFVDPASSEPLYITPDDATGCGQMDNEIKFNMPKNPDGLISMLLTQNAQYPIALVDRQSIYSDFTLRAKRFFDPDGIVSESVNGALCAQPTSSTGYDEPNFQMNWSCDEYPLMTRDYHSGATYGGTPCWSTPLGILADSSTTITSYIYIDQDLSPGNKTFELIVYDQAGNIVDTVAGTASPDTWNILSTPGAGQIGHVQVRLKSTSSTQLVDINSITIRLTIVGATGRSSTGPTFYNLIENPSFASLATKGKNYVIRSKSGLISFRGNDNYGGSVAYRQLDSALPDIPFGGIFDYAYTASLQDSFDGVLETGLYAFWQPLDLIRDLSYHHVFDSRIYSPLMVFAGTQDTTTETLRCVVSLLIQYTTLSDAEKPIIPRINYEAYELAVSLLAKFNPGSENPSHLTRINKAMSHINKFADSVGKGLHTANEIVKIVGPVLAKLAVGGAALLL
jgi:hypothetical protein